MPAVSNLQYLFDALLPQRVASQVACLARLFLLSIMFFIVLIPPFFFPAPHSQLPLSLSPFCLPGSCSPTSPPFASFVTLP